MKHAIAIAAVLALCAATASGATVPQAASAVTSGTPTPEVSDLAARIRTALATSRTNAASTGLSGQALELAISGNIETVIAASGAAPDVVLATLQLAIAEEKCTLTPELLDQAPGCQALADIAAAVASAIGGPAAVGGTGTVPAAVSGPPPRGATGSDYAN